MNARLPRTIVQPPPLENGDTLSRAEFERRYHAMPHVKKAELLEGVVHMPSPVSLEHAEPHFDLIGVLAIYRMMTPGLRGADNGTVRLDLDNEPQPDVVLFVDPACGGNLRIDPDGYLNGAPELAAEIAASSVSIDLGTKFRVYQRNAIQEYLVWRVQDEAIDWFILKEGHYEALTPGAVGISRSVILPGLWLDTQALLRGDTTRVQEVLQQGIQSQEHRAFVERLQARRMPPA